MKQEEILGRVLTERSLKIAVAESCTGGLIANRITDIDGASNYFDAGLITYSNEAKTRFLGVPEDIIREKGAVSSEVAMLMAEGVRAKTGVDIGVSSTGIAGPTGGTKEKPVGTVFIAISSKEGTFVRRLSLKGTRMEIKKQTSDEVLKFIEDYIEGRLR
ncbi:MAG TPA: CinA family protein [Syntrophorhabdaceae bacterium]|nr:CinA family protein [Syntrophorhabdaceae bacterium]HOT42897.1 CinA family protein [Syntrophorhabdaceae bacterium]HPC67633.1 CinA family protein [Syntrophorhabdaceae bacterium]HPP41956.1 CinA family protein [Syntrophorhabdaceae bacterium]HQH44157.1 CinA family protein [Syntrophorhabdaceae bacterium]